MRWALPHQFYNEKLQVKSWDQNSGCLVPKPVLLCWHQLLLPRPRPAALPSNTTGEEQQKALLPAQAHMRHDTQ